MIAVVITIDTEADHRGDAWIKSDPLTFASIGAGVRKQLAPLFASASARPTYLLTTEVLDDAASVEILGRLSGSELGTHLHGDHVAPEARAPDPAGQISHDFTCFYPEELERGKIETLTRQFRDRFGRAPRSYRAGRYAASGRTARILAESGYLVETSVTPGVRWINERHPEQQLDFAAAPPQPYRPSELDLARPGQLPIWEVPVTILRRPRWWNAGVGLAQRMLGRPVVPMVAWLRPSIASAASLRWLVRQVTARARPERLTVLNVMFHSMEVVVGASPHSATESDAQRVLRRLSLLLRELQRMEARFVTLSELAGLLSEQEQRS